MAHQQVLSQNARRAAHGLQASTASNPARCRRSASTLKPPR